MKLVGFAENAAEGVAWLVLPWAANGNLREFVRSEPWDLPERASLVRFAPLPEVPHTKGQGTDGRRRMWCGIFTQQATSNLPWGFEIGKACTDTEEILSEG